MLRNICRPTPDASAYQTGTLLPDCHPSQSPPAQDTFHPMDTAPRPDDRPAPETEAERQHRCEAEGIARARASIAAGFYATSREVDAWIDSLASANPLPVPYPRQPRPR